MAEIFAGKDSRFPDPTMRHASGQSETAPASSFAFAGEEPKGTDPSGTFILVKFFRRLMGDTLYGDDPQEAK